MATDLEIYHTEQELLEQLRSGSEAAFTKVYRLYSAQLFKKILRMVYDEDIAKELLQDLFMKIWEGREKIDPSRSFKSFLYAVGINLVYDYFRKTAKKNVMIARLISTAVEQYTHTEEGIIEKENMDIINSAVQKLPPQRKRVFVLCKLEGKSYAEVSKELNISSSTIHDHMVKANCLIRKYLQNHPDMAIYTLLSIVFIYMP